MAPRCRTSNSSGVKFTHKNGRPMVSGTLLQKDAPDALVTSVPLYAKTPGGKPVYLGRVFADGPETEFHLPVPNRSPRSADRSASNRAHAPVSGARGLRRAGWPLV